MQSTYFEGVLALFSCLESDVVGPSDEVEVGLYLEFDPISHLIVDLDCLGGFLFGLAADLQQLSLAARHLGSPSEVIYDQLLAQLVPESDLAAGGLQGLRGVGQ